VGSVAGNLRIVSRPLSISDPEFRIEETLFLPPDEVHVWQIELNALAEAEARWRSVLSGDEKARADRFRFQRDRQRFSSTRAMLRIILGAYVGTDPETLVFQYSEKGKPGLDSSGMEFNVSHSGNIGLLAFSRERQVGIDVEEIRQNLDPEKIARRFFSEHEQSQLAALCLPERFAGFFRCWTRKEAYIKARGEGLSLPLDTFDVSIEPGEQNALLACRMPQENITSWRLQDLSVPEGYVAALCVQGRGWLLKSWLS